MLAQVVSNFANEYYDYVAGTDKKGREGPRRGVTEGTISPTAMRNATFGTLAVACLVGLCLIPYGGWWLIGVGIAIAVFALAYSAGPYPLSRHGLGDVAVLVFFGLVPVNFTFYLMTGEWTLNALLLSVAIGLLGMNVLIVNNYRDADDDRSVGKYTTVVLLGRKTMSTVYAVGGIVAVALLAVILLCANCSTTRKLEADAVPMGYTELQNYYVSNTVSVKQPFRHVFTTEEEFSRYFGEAATMSPNGQPTVVNWGTQYVLAVINPSTDRATRMYPVSVLQNGDAIIFNYKVEKGEKQSYTTTPYVAVVLDKPVSQQQYTFYYNEK